MEERTVREFSEEPVFHNGSVNSALTRIKNTLNYTLKDQYNIEDPEITEKFIKMHGLSKDHFDFINNFESLVEKGIADNSVDTNANKSAVSITGFFTEAAMPINKLVGYRYLYRKMKEMYGKQRAKYLSGEMYDMSLAIADSTNILKPYCYSINASKLVFEGKPFGTLPSAPPQHLQSYIANLNELIHQLSNHTAGAIAVGSFFLDIAHILIYREHKTLEDLKRLDERKAVENCIQSFIHSMNHLSRNAVESPFVNISIFDRTKLLSLIADDNMGWYFDKEDAIDGVPERALKDCGSDDWHEYVVKIMLELEDIYMNIMDAGDKCHNGRPITFPVSTVNLSRVKKDDKYTFAEPEFVDYVCQNHDIMRYNIYISEGEKIASCHDFENPLYYFDKKNHSYIEAIGSFVEKHLVNGKKEALIEEGFFVKDENNNLIPITGVFKLPNTTEELIEIEFDNGQILKVTPDHKFKVKVDNEEKEVAAKELLENPEIYEF